MNIRFTKVDEVIVKFNKYIIYSVNDKLCRLDSPYFINRRYEGLVSSFYTDKDYVETSLREEIRHLKQHVLVDDSLKEIGFLNVSKSETTRIEILREETEVIKYLRISVNVDSYFFNKTHELIVRKE